MDLECLRCWPRHLATAAAAAAATIAAAAAPAAASAAQHPPGSAVGVAPSLLLGRHGIGDHEVIGMMIIFVRRLEVKGDV